MPRNNIVVLDAGNSIIKARSPENEIHFRHALVRLTDAEFSEIFARAQYKIPPGYVRVNGIPYAYGERAESRGVITRQRGAARYHREYYGTLAAIALTQIYPSASTETLVYGSHAPQDIHYAKDLTRAVIGTYHCEFGDVERHYKVSGAATFDEPLGGLMNVMLTHDGGYNQRWQYTDGATLVIDIGGVTTDLIAVQPGGKIDYNIAISLEVGIQEAETNFERAIRSSLRDLLKSSGKLPEDRVRAALQTGQLKAAGQTFSVENEKTESTFMLLNRLADAYQSKAGGPARWDHIILTGGGSAMLADDLINRVLEHHSVSLADDDRDSLYMANVRGGLRLWRVLQREGVYPL